MFVEEALSVLAGLLGLVAAVGILIGPWVSLARTRALKREVAVLRNLLQQLQDRFDGSGVAGVAGEPFRPVRKAPVASEGDCREGDPPADFFPAAGTGAAARSACAARPGEPARRSAPAPGGASGAASALEPRRPGDPDPEESPEGSEALASTPAPISAHDVRPGAEPGVEQDAESGVGPDAKPGAESDVQSDAGPGAGGKSQPRPGWEQRFLAKLPVWVGGIALALAGLFLVKYSIEQQLLSPAVRVLLGFLAGFGLLLAGWKVRRKPDFANGERISQALAGAGVAVLYAAILAATSLYGFFPRWLGLAGLVATTAAAVLLSLGFGPPVALLGLGGGLITPAFLGSDEPSAMLFFGYQFLLFSGLTALIRRKGWWWLGIPLLIGDFLWILIWLGLNYGPGDALWLGLFILGVTGVMGAMGGFGPAEAPGDAAGEGQGPGAEKRFPWRRLLDWSGMGGGVLMMGLVLGRANFDLLAWGMVGALAVGTLALAFWREAQYRFLPWISMISTAAMLFAWAPDVVFSPGQPWTWPLVNLAFALLYAGAGVFFMFRSANPFGWALLAGMAALGYFLDAWFQMPAFAGALAHFWGALSALLAFACIGLFRLSWRRLAGYPKLPHLLALFAALAAAFASLALVFELDRRLLPVAFAAEALALAWIDGKAPVKALRWILAAVALVFAALLLPQIALLIQLSAFSLAEVRLPLQSGLPMVAHPTIQLGLPALFFLVAAWLLRRQGPDDRLVKSLEGAAIPLLVVMAYYLARSLLHGQSDALFVKAGFMERGVITNGLLLLALLCMEAGLRFGRTVFLLGGRILFGVGIFRIVWFDLGVHNPMLDVSQDVLGWPLINGLALPYLLPLGWLWLALKRGHLPQGELAASTPWRRRALAAGRLLPLILFWFWVTANVAFLFRGEIMAIGSVGAAEVYAYSVAWLVMGLGLLWAGLHRRDPLLRRASLLLLILTVGKVFLFDAAELDGLYRVVSFLGLGISLIGLSWFYAHFDWDRLGADADGGPEAGPGLAPGSDPASSPISRPASASSPSEAGG